MDRRQLERERWQRQRERERAGAAAVASAGQQWKREIERQREQSVTVARGLEGASGEAACWRVGECAAVGWQRERKRALAVAGAEALGCASGRPRNCGRPGAFALECRRLRRRQRRRVPSIFVSLAEAQETSSRAGGSKSIY